LTQVYIVHQLSGSQSDTQRPADWAQAPVICFFDFAASAGDNDVTASAPASMTVAIVLVRMEQTPGWVRETNHFPQTRVLNNLVAMRDAAS
jgi:hypothetical protein